MNLRTPNIRQRRGQDRAEDGPFGWFRGMDVRGRRAFGAAFGGYGLDSYDYQLLTFAVTAIGLHFGVGTGRTGLLITVTLVASAVGGVAAGVLADRIGRTRTLQLTVAVYTVFTVLCGFAPSFESLLVFRGLQGLGFGGEWATGAMLVAEFARARHRGRVLAYVQSAWAVGWALAVVVNTVVFNVFPVDVAWRVLFWTGALPALLLVWIRRRVSDAGASVPRPVPRASWRRSLLGLFTGGLARTTALTLVLTTGVQGGYYTLSGWLPTYLTQARGLDVYGSGGYLAILISGAFVGYVSAGYLADGIGRKWTFLLFSVLSGGFLLAYAQVPAEANTAVLLLGFPLGFCTSAIFSGFGSYLAELFPAELRATGAGFTYNVGRALGAVFPAVAGFLAQNVGLGGAMAVGAFGYVLAALALLGLPETRGRVLASVGAG